MSRARDLAKLGNTNVIAVNGIDVGFGTLDPKEKVNVVGVVSATSFYGDGSTLDGIASAGIGTALSEDKTKALNAIYYTNNELTLSTTSTIDPPDSGYIAYTQAPTLTIEDTKELIISDGDDLLVDVLGIGTGTNVDYAARGNGVFGNIYVDNIESQGGQTSVNFPRGLVSSGVATFTSDVSIGGTLTYEDVKNVDSVGLITARTGIKVTAGGVDIAGGGIDIVGDIGLGAGKQTGTAGQLLTSGGSGADATWTTISSAPTITGICSGIMPANRAVCVHSDGKVGVVTGTASLLSTGVQLDDAFNFGNQGQEVAYGNNVVVAFYSEQNSKSYVRAGTISGTTITWGARVEAVDNEQGSQFIVYNAVANNFVVAYRRSNIGRLKLVSVSGTTCTVGSEVDYKSSNGYIENVAMAYDSTAEKIVIAYKEGNTNQCHARVITADSSSISLGTENSNVFGATGGNLWLYYDSVTNKTYLSGHDDSLNYMALMIGTISGTDITFANKQQPLGNVYGAYKSPMVRDTKRNKIVFVGRGTGSTNKFYYTFGTWGGSNFTWSTPVTWDLTELPGNFKIEYNPYADKIVMIGENTTANKATYWSGKFAEPYEDDPNIIHWSQQALLSASTSGEWLSLANIPDGVVMTYASNTIDTGNNLHYSVEQYQNSTLNDDGMNFLGYSNASYTNGQTATINVVGNVASGQVGLTTGSNYYIQGDGGVILFYFANKNTVANVTAGTAISHDQLLIRGL